MINFLKQLLDLIYKKRCYFCLKSEENTIMCSKCYKKINFFHPKKFQTLDNVPVYCASLYADEVKKMIRGIKYHNQKELAFFQAKLMYDYWKKLTVSQEYFAIVPVPLFKEREVKRKYNHMQLVAEEFAKLTGYSVNSDLIFRIKDTKPQYKLTKKQREKNLKDAFECKKENYHDEKLLLIDDILTTGSTMSEMIKTFRKSKIEDLTIFVTSCSEFNTNKQFDF